MAVALKPQWPADEGSARPEPRRMAPMARRGESIILGCCQKTCYVAGMLELYDHSRARSSEKTESL